MTPFSQPAGVANHDTQDWNFCGDIPNSDDDNRLLPGAGRRRDGIAISSMAFVYRIGGSLLDCYTLDSDAARDQPLFSVRCVSLSWGGLCLYDMARFLLI